MLLQLRMLSALELRRMYVTIQYIRMEINEIADSCVLVPQSVLQLSHSNTDMSSALLSWMAESHTIEPLDESKHLAAANEYGY
jgi:ankyrin repeat protein